MSQSSRKLIEEYMLFSKYQRSQHLKALKNCFEGIVENRLLEETYTCEEVEAILRDVRDSICGEVESESMSVSHMTVLLLRQLVQQAEEAGLQLRGDISEMQNGELLEQIKAEEMSSCGEPLQNQNIEIESGSNFATNRQQSCGVAHENLKKILTKKNEVIMQLREKLLKYESDD